MQFKNAYIGDTAIAKMYRGDTLIYPKGARTPKYAWYAEDAVITGGGNGTWAEHFGSGLDFVLTNCTKSADTLNIENGNNSYAGITRGAWETLIDMGYHWDLLIDADIQGNSAAQTTNSYMIDMGSVTSATKGCGFSVNWQGAPTMSNKMYGTNSSNISTQECIDALGYMCEGFSHTKYNTYEIIYSMRRKDDATSRLLVTVNGVEKELPKDIQAVKYANFNVVTSSYTGNKTLLVGRGIANNYCCGMKIRKIEIYVND